jgi:hypothetical protein
VTERRALDIAMRVTFAACGVALLTGAGMTINTMVEYGADALGLALVTLAAIMGFGFLVAAWPTR